jgi:hypothetical protein
MMKKDQTNTPYEPLTCATASPWLVAPSASRQAGRHAPANPRPPPQAEHSREISLLSYQQSTTPQIRPASPARALELPSTGRHVAKPWRHDPAPPLIGAVRHGRDREPHPRRALLGDRPSLAAAVTTARLDPCLLISGTSARPRKARAPRRLHPDLRLPRAAAPVCLRVGSHRLRRVRVPAQHAHRASVGHRQARPRPHHQQPQARRLP